MRALVPTRELRTLDRRFGLASNENAADELAAELDRLRTEIERLKRPE